MIDSELTRALLQPDDNLSIGKAASIRKIISAPHLDWETEVDIGKDRTVDILITVNYRHESPRAIAIEIENDRKLDIEAVLRRIKRQKTYSTVVIIPKEFERHSFQFQKSGIPVYGIGRLHADGFVEIVEKQLLPQAVLHLASANTVRSKDF